MASFAKIQQRLKSFDFAGLFTQELLWDNFSGHDLDIHIDGKHYKLAPVAEQSGMAVYLCTPSTAAEFPNYPTRRKIDNRVTKFVREHIVIYQDPAKQFQIWQWVKREAGKVSACREQRFEVRQTGDALIQKLLQITFSLEDEPPIGEVREKVKKAFDLEKVTKRFYDEFKSQHAAFLKFLKGIPDEHLQRWYASVMLNRLMFIYFIQKKGFLGGDLSYLKNRLSASKKSGKNLFYREFLCPLFFEGFAKRESDRSAKTRELLGVVPYLNGGLFLKHQIENAHEKNIEIPDLAFEKIFAFFDQYQWHLDDRPTRDGNEINPDVLGYVFEKYINQKEMGAYYTKEDITGYIGQNTIIPAVFDIARKGCKVAFEGEHSIWNLLKEDPDRYFYAAVLHGTGQALPKEVAAGIKDIAKRSDWNKTAPEDYGLPTETWREVVARRQRYEEVRGKLATGAIQSINDLITYNLDIQRFAEEVISNSEGSDLVWAFYKAVEKLSVLDPTCGSGAFLFAALNILEKLYDTCLVRMQAFVDDLDQSGEKHSPKKFEHFRLKLAEMNDKSKHPSPRYFILKSIILNNLYGVDIMEEATEICKLRLFLKLVAQVNAGERIEPLPDIDFNIQPGNTLIGFATAEELHDVIGSTFDYESKVQSIRDRAELARKAFERFRHMQVEHGLSSEEFKEAKECVQECLRDLREELDDHLAGEYGISHSDRKGRGRWRESHRPFHWFLEFYGVMNSGGFDVVIGNPPYVEYSKVRSTYAVKRFRTIPCGNLYCFVLEQSFKLVSPNGRTGLIIPLSFVCTDRMNIARSLVKGYECWIPSFDIRPSSLFEGVTQRLSIVMATPHPTGSVIRTAGYRRWFSEERDSLMATMVYATIPETLRSFRIPKLTSDNEVKLLAKLQAPSIEYLKRVDGQPFFVHRIVRYFIKAVSVAPLFIAADGKKGKSEDYKEFRFDREQQSGIAAVINSSTFYWFWRSHSDGFHCGYGDVYQLPYRLPSVEVRKHLEKLQAALMLDLGRHSETKTVKTKAGTIKYQEFYLKKSKPIIDQIDAVIGGHLELSAEELDFVINYDLKYRVGSGAENDLEELSDAASSD